jgi:putative acetyltransferase
MALIRKEAPSDIDAAKRLNELAFEGDTEAAIVDKLRELCEDIISLVVEVGERSWAISYSAPWGPRAGTKRSWAWASPRWLVLPDHQRKGIGSELVRAGLAELRKKNCPFVIVLGHPGYYPRFAFEPSSRHSIKCEWEVPDEAFMVVVFDDSSMPESGGKARYRHEFSQAM